MKRHSVMVAEDNPADLESILDLIATRADLELCGTATDGGEAMALLRKRSYELAFLDVDMPVFSGLDVLGLSGKRAPSQVIVTTAYPDFAVSAFDHHVLDFLVKPYKAKRFNHAVERFLVRAAEATTASAAALASDESAKMEAKAAAETSEEESRSEDRLGADKDFLRFSGRGYNKIIPIRDIIYVASNGRRSDLHCLDGDTVVNKLFGEILTLLPSSFLQIHRQYTVNLAFLDSLVGDFTGAHTVRLLDADETELPAGRTFLQGLRYYLSSR